MSHQLETIIGYKFKNPKLLETALTHTSYANESRTPVKHNERLEFLGDSVLGFVTADFLFQRQPDAPEGELTRTRARLVCEESLHGVAQRLKLGDYLCLGHGEEAGGGRKRASILADATEAVIAAVFLDGGIEEASALIHRVLLDDVSEVRAAEKRLDYKTALQELVQRKPGRALSYALSGESGPDHAKTFTITVKLDGAVIGTGEGHSKKEAEQMAARDALSRFEETE